MNSKQVINLLWLLPIFIFCGNTLSAQQKKSDLQKKRTKILQEIKLTNDLIAKNKNSKELTANEIKTLDTQIRLRQSLVNNIDKEVKSIKRKINENEEVIVSLEESLNGLKKEYSQLVYLSYKNRNSQDQLMYIFAADDFFQALRRMQFLKDLSSHREEQGQLISDSKVSIDKKNQELLSQKNEKEVLLSEAIAAKRDIDKDKRRKEEALALINKDQKKLQSELQAKKEQDKKLSKAIEKLIAAEIAKNRPKGTSKGFKLTPDEELQSKYFSKNKGSLPWPVEKGVIVGKFGRSAHESMAGIQVDNNGIDIATDINSTVRAIFGGEVSGIINIPGAGMAIVVKHGEFRAVYSNIHEVYVKKGDILETKQRIGILKNDGHQANCHLEIWKITSKGMEKENPASWIAN